MSMESNNINITIKTEPDDSFDKCLNELISSTEGTNHRESNNFDLDLGLGFEGLEPMDFSNLTNDSAISPPLLTPTSSIPMAISQNNSIVNPMCNVPMPSMDLIPATSTDDHVGMDVDIEWFDSMISPPSPPITTCHSMNHPELPTNLQQQSTSSLFHSNNNENNRDPMLSVTSALHDPLDLFSLGDTDFKGPADLNNSLNWDTIDFAA